MTNNGGKGVVCPHTAQDRPPAPQETQYAEIPLRIDPETGFGATRAICGLVNHPVDQPRRDGQKEDGEELLEPRLIRFDRETGPDLRADQHGCRQNGSKPEIEMAPQKVADEPGQSGYSDHQR
jgi:hypothetical protein